MRLTDLFRNTAQKMTNRRSWISLSPDGGPRCLIQLRMILRQTAWVLMGITLLAMTGCKGCSSTDPNDPKAKEEARKKLEEEKKKKDDLEIGQLQPLLGQELSEDQLADRKPKLLVKPGHWMPTSRRMKANFDDFILEESSTVVDDNRQPVKLPLTPFTFELSRPVALAKGKAKNVTSEVFVPDDVTSKRLRSTLVNRKNSANKVETFPELLKMPSYQYFFLVLASEPTRYSYLKVTDTVLSPWEEEWTGETERASMPHYRVALADATKNIPLSPNVLSWSSIAVLIWDEVDPTRLSPEQQEALLDWLHWGGRLIVNGPDSLDTLRDSFLDPYLPADADGMRNVTADDLRGWSTYWGRRGTGEEVPPLEPVRPMSGVKLVPREGVREVAGGAKLFYEGNVGLGSIVVSSIQLSQREFINWPGYDSFLNSALLGRPRRVFRQGPYEGVCVTWRDAPNSRLDAHLNTGVRVMTRDLAEKANVRSVEKAADSYNAWAGPTQSYAEDRPGGVAAWNPQSAVSNASRNLLVEAAGVEMPDARFVLLCVGMYLIVLVPLNWMVFRTVGRVELAWAAAPFIAILGTYGVVWMAQLDIGFVRAQTEVAVLEMHGGYPRGILSRYTAFYSSLSTTYDAKFEYDQSVATPFPVRLDANDPTLRNERYDVSFEKHASTNLHGLAISSNSTRMLQSEQVFPMEGGMKLGVSSRGHMQVENNSGLDLKDVFIVRRYFPDLDGPPAYKASWIGILRHSTSEVLGLTGYAYQSDKLPFAEERSPIELEGTKSLKVDALLKLACQFPDKEDPRYDRREEYRLVGRIDEVLPGMEVTPDASQIQGVTIVVAHLEYGDLPLARPDVNSHSDVVQSKPGFLDD